MTNGLSNGFDSSGPDYGMNVYTYFVKRKFFNLSMPSSKALSYEDIYKEERRAKKEIEIISIISRKEDQVSVKLREVIEQFAVRIENISKISVDAIADIKREMR